VASDQSYGGERSAAARAGHVAGPDHRAPDTRAALHSVFDDPETQREPTVAAFA
jgi:hypothetical protein